MVEQLGGIDAAFVGLESSAGLLQGVGVVRLDPDARPLELDELIGLIAHRLPRLDLLRRRLVTVPGGLDRPYWVDVAPDLSAHVRVHELPRPGVPEDFEGFCAEMAATKLDRSRPLWEFALVNGLASGGQALVIKVHHSLCDGIGSLALIAQLLDQHPETSSDDEGAPEPSPEEPPPATPWLLVRAVANALRRSVDAVTTSVELVGSALRLRGYLESVADADLAAPLATPHLSFHGQVSARRSVAFRDLPLEGVKEIAHASGTHVNDVIIALLAGTLRRWLIMHDELPDEALVAAVPVSTRGPDELLSPGNHVSACFVHLPTQLADPRERLEVSAAVADRGKALHAAVGQETLERLTELAVPFALSAPARLYQRSGLASMHPSPVNLVVSNVAGPPFDLFLAGRTATALYALGPIFDGVALNITAISFRGRLGFGYVTCPDRLPDLGALADQQEPAFEELAAAYAV
jgi:diacylglycerol O-acyltransferase / wax synthase